MKLLLPLICFLCFSCENTKTKTRIRIEQNTPFVVNKDTCQWKLNTDDGRIKLHIISTHVLSKNDIKAVVDTITKTSFSNYDFMEFYATEIYADEKYAWYVKSVNEIYESHLKFRNRFEFLIDKIDMKCGYIKSVFDTKTLNNANTISKDFIEIENYYKELISLSKSDLKYRTDLYNSQKEKCHNDYTVLKKEFNKQKKNIK